MSWFLVFFIVTFPAGYILAFQFFLFLTSFFLWLSPGLQRFLHYFFIAIFSAVTFSPSSFFCFKSFFLWLCAGFQRFFKSYFSSGCVLVSSAFLHYFEKIFFPDLYTSINLPRLESGIARPVVVQLANRR